MDFKDKMDDLIDEMIETIDNKVTLDAEALTSLEERMNNALKIAVETDDETVEAIAMLTVCQVGLELGTNYYTKFTPRFLNGRFTTIATITEREQQ